MALPWLIVVRPDWSEKPIEICSMVVCTPEIESRSISKSEELPAVPILMVLELASGRITTS